MRASDQEPSMRHHLFGLSPVMLGLIISAAFFFAAAAVPLLLPL